VASHFEPTPQPIELVIVRALATASLAGFVAGMIAGGAGARIAMRITAIAAGSADQGAITEFEATVGEITAGGTVFLVLLGGFVGVAGGLIYLSLRRWVADAGRWRGLLFGVLFFAMFGSAIIKNDNPDFRLFGPPALNIAMFASMFVVFGLLIAPIFDWIVNAERALPPPSLRLSGLPSLAGHAFGLVLLLPALGATGIVAIGGGTLSLPYVLIVVPIASVVITRRAGPFERLSDLRGHPGALGAALAVLLVAVVAGLALNAISFVDIFRAGE
jgi:hypothetical protein